jgi:SAM-dependent methyltransferase
VESSDVKHYYDTTTAWFLQFGATRSTGAIHRALHLADVPSAQPTDTVHALIQQAITMYVPHATAGLDLGCGVGASLARMAVLAPQLTTLRGVTISRQQALMAQTMQRPVVQASYHALPFPDASFDVLWAIESLLHSHTPWQFYAEAMRCLRPGGVLCICDDLLADGAAPQPWLPAFRDGWQAHALLTVAQHRSMAQMAGLRLCEVRNLTPGLTLHLLPHALATLIATTYPRWASHPLVTSMVGSMALQHALHSGDVQYTWMVLKKDD